MGSYFPATRHPWSCVIFVLPLLLTYEIGLYLAGPGQPELLRNGADAWLRMGLGYIGLRASYWAPTLLLSVLVLWSLFRRTDRPPGFAGVWFGMALESGTYALGLWGISRFIWPLLENLGIKVELSILNLRLQTGAGQQVLGFIGAGVYEETLFRLLAFSGIQCVLRLADFPWPLSGILAALASAVLFAAAHNVGPNGETFNGYVFFFRSLAGLYFTALYHFRGFGIAVGAHAGYDVLVGVLVPRV